MTQDPHTLCSYIYAVELSEHNKTGLHLHSALISFQEEKMKEVRLHSSTHLSSVGQNAMIFQGMKLLVTQSCPTLCNPTDCSICSSVHGILQARIPEKGLPLPSPGDLTDPGIKPGSAALQKDALSSEPPGKPFSRREDWKYFTLISHASASEEIEVPWCMEQVKNPRHYHCIQGTEKGITSRIAVSAPRPGD